MNNDTTVTNLYPPGNPASLPQHIRQLTEGGAHWEDLGYTSKFAARKAVAYHMAIGNWTFEDAARYILTDQTLPAWDLWGSGRTQLGYNGRLQRLIKDWRQATGFASSHKLTRADVLAICGEIRATMDTSEWKGVAGRNDRKALTLAVEFAEATGSLEVRLAIREVMLRCGIGSNNTAMKTLLRLTENGWIAPTGKERATGQGAQYKLQNCTKPRVKSVIDSKSGAVAQQQKLRAQLMASEFGKRFGTGAEVWLQLTDEPVTAAEIGDRADVHRSTAGRWLRNLEREGYAVQLGGRWVRGAARWGDFEPSPRADRAYKSVAECREVIEAERENFHKDDDEAVSGNTAKLIPAKIACDECSEVAWPLRFGMCNDCLSATLRDEGLRTAV